MKFNRINQLLRNEAGDGDLGGDGLSARLDKFVSENSFDDKGNVVEPVTKPAAVGGGDPPPSDTPDKREEPVKPTEVATIPDEEDDLPEIGGKKTETSKTPDLDFDAQTDAIVKAIEAKGHPGDEYKRLRAEVKELRQRKPIDDLDSVPEVKELRQKAAEADRFKAEADALRERQRELLKANDEVAVRESDEFINAVRRPIAEMESVVEQMATSIEVDPEALFSIISEGNIAKQDKMLEALHQKVGSRMAGRIERFCDDYKAIQSKGASMLSEASKNAEKARLAREVAVREESKQKAELFRTSAENAFNNYAKRIPGFVDSSGNLTDAAQAAMAKTTSLDVASLSPDDLGYMAFAANALPDARRAIVALQKEVALLKGTKGAPSAIGGKPAAPPAKEDDYQGLSERMAGMEFSFTPPS